MCTSIQSPGALAGEVSRPETPHCAFSNNWAKVLLYFTFARQLIHSGLAECRNLD